MPGVTVVGFLVTTPTLAADEGGIFGVNRSYVRNYATLEHAAGTNSAGTLTEGRCTWESSNTD